MPKPGFTIRTSSARHKTADAIDVAARYFVYKMYDATDHRPMTWQVLREIGEASATVSRAVERGWVIVRPNESGRVKEHSGCLTDEGRRIARRSLVRFIAD